MGTLLPFVQLQTNVYPLNSERVVTSGGLVRNGFSHETQMSTRGIEQPVVDICDRCRAHPDTELSSRRFKRFGISNDRFGIKTRRNCLPDQWCIQHACWHIARVSSVIGVVPYKLGLLKDAQSSRLLLLSPTLVPRRQEVTPCCLESTESDSTRTKKLLLHRRRPCFLISGSTEVDCAEAPRRISRGVVPSRPKKAARSPPDSAAKNS